MNILIPKNLFLRVRDKFVADFIDHDAAVPTNPTLLYKKIFAEAHATGVCTLTQAHLAAQCKFSVRALQHALRRLVELRYVEVKSVPGSCNSYVLLHSERVRELLASYDLIEHSDWYSRSTQPARPHSRKAPAHLVHGGYEPGAHPSYNVEKKEKSLTPLSPLPSDTRRCIPSPDVSQSSGSTAFPQASGGGDAFSSNREKKPQDRLNARESDPQAFARLYAAWPVKKDEARALRVFCSLARAGQLPALDELLATVQRFSLEDRHWRNGFAPLLSTWLKDRRWRDEPLSVQTSRADGADCFSSGVQPAFSSPSITQQVGLPAPPPSPMEPALKQAADTLCSLWGDTSRMKIIANIGLARIRGVEITQLVEKAQAYFQHLGGMDAPKPMADWLQGELSA